VLYLNTVHHWGAGKAGLALTAYAAATILAQGVLAGPVAHRLGEKGAIVMGFAFGVVGLGLIGFAAWPPMLWIGVAAIAPVNIGIAAIQSLRSKLVEASEQGRLQGAMISLAGLAGIVGPVIFAGLLAWSIGAGRGLSPPGLCMLAGAAVFVAAIAITVVTVSPRPPVVATE
jgi:DHA1 family tetracycline resistance protein-like MFS transporter